MRSDRSQRPTGNAPSTRATRRTSLAIALLSLLASAPSAIAAPGELPAPEDALPQLPLRPTPAPAKSDQWLQWNSVDRLRGLYSADRASVMSRGDGAESGSSLHAATASFEIVRISGHFDVINVASQGTYHQQSAADRWDYHGKSSQDGSFSGPTGFRFDMHPNDGTWTFGAEGTFGLKTPYTVTSILHSRTLDSGRWIETNRTSTKLSTDFPHANIRGTLTVGTPGPLRGQMRINQGTLKTSLSDYEAHVTLVPEYKDVELEIELDGTVPGKGAVAYDAWIPRGTLTGAAGSRMKVKARLQSPDGGPVNLRVALFTFKLTDVSREPGTCLNFPKLAPATPSAAYAPDLKFAPIGGTDADRQTLELLPTLDDPTHPRAEARIDCYDFGAWADLSVSAELEDGRIVTGHMKGDKGKIVIPIPKRAPGSHIADAWKKEKNLTAPDDDDNEKAPGIAPAAGDGFSLYEEYRGFAHDGRFLEGDPAKIDFFVRNYIGADARPGIRLFQNLTHAVVHDRLNDAEFDKAKRVMNANHAQGAHPTDQHGIFIQTLAGLDGAQTVLSKAGLRGRPVITLGIEVQPKGAATKTVTNENARLADMPLAYDRAVAHELLHAVGAVHHGQNDMHWGFSFAFSDDPRNTTGKAQFWLSGTNRAVEITDEKSGRPLAELWEPDLMLAREHDREYFTPGIKAEVTAGLARSAGIQLQYTPEEIEQVLLNDHFGHHYWYIGGKNGEGSGDEQCVMRYSFASLFEKIGKSFAWYYISDKHTETLGMGLCTSPAGTGVNLSGRKPQPRYGDAVGGAGDCADHITFSDAPALERAP